MATHLVAFRETLGGAVVDSEIDSVQDDILTRPSTERFTVPAEYNNIHMAYLQATTIGRGRIVTPSLEVRRSTPFITPHERGTIPTLLTPAMYMPKKPIVLIPQEELSVRVTDAVAEAVTALVLLGVPTLPEVPDGDIRRVRCTSATTLVAGAWSSCVLTPDTQIEAGVYALVNMIAHSVGVVGARAIIQGQAFRPGVLGIPAATEPPALEYSVLYETINKSYEMGRFPHNVIPQVQFLSISADTAETVYLDMVKVG